jgi:hypothetical protein
LAILDVAKRVAYDTPIRLRTQVSFHHLTGGVDDDVRRAPPQGKLRLPTFIVDLSPSLAKYTLVFLASAGFHFMSYRLSRLAGPGYDLLGLAACLDDVLLGLFSDAGGFLPAPLCRLELIADLVASPVERRLQRAADRPAGKELRSPAKSKEDQDPNGDNLRGPPDEVVARQHRNCHANPSRLTTAAAS